MATNTLPGNPHIKNAEYIDRAPEIRLIDATLALAHEQRTANLIAMLGIDNLADVNYDYVLKQILNRMGL